MSTTLEPTHVDTALKHTPRFHTLTGVQALGIGAYVPTEVVTNEDLAALGYDSDWIVQRTGIHTRRRATPDQATSDVAYEASRRCLDAAGLAACDIDLILFATVTPDQPMPATACILQQKLGCGAPAMDMNAACSGFIYGLATGAQFIHSGHSRHVLVVGADLMSRVVNPRDKKTFPLFGDGAGAVLLGAGDSDQGLLSYMLGADGEGADLLGVRAGGSKEPMNAGALQAARHLVHMDGRPVFKWAIRTVGGALRETLNHAGKSVLDVDLLVLHQANVRIIDALVAELGIAPSKVVVNVDSYGNTSAGSIPLALWEAVQQGRVLPGDLVLLCGFGAGLTWGSALWRW